MGMKKLRADLIRAINNLLSGGKIKEIYFTQFHFN
jgi:flagellar basal body-associated protein FliL